MAIRELREKSISQQHFREPGDKMCSFFYLKKETSPHRALDTPDVLLCAKQ
jgi:hypothetical protein